MKPPRTLSALLLLLASMSALHAAEPTAPIPLWPQGAPGALGTSPKDIPTLTPCLPAKPNSTGAAMLLIPGGSYSGIYEGQAEPFALWLNAQGITVFVLRYRLGSAGYRYPVQLQDAVEAMRQIRGNAAKWKINPQRLGVMGFSAGGHLVSTLLNHPEDGEVPGSAGLPPAPAAQRVSPRPDIAILCYPVISMATQPHAASRKNLIGDSPTPELIRKTSSELQVKPGLPPCFLWHTNEDKMVPPAHSLLFATALHQHGVPHEFHLYQHGDHGTGLMGTDHPWFQDLLFWLKAQKFIE
ncbi:MAG: alpha/beta hydrolase [Prosthecobacter sp.]